MPVKKKPRKTAGRPKAIIDWREVGKMLEAGCTAVGIAETIGIDVDTLYNRCKDDNKMDFSTFRQQKKAKGEDMLREVQFNEALAGNTSMLIWLGKNRLGQSDKSNVEIGGTLETLLITPKADDSE